MIYEFWYKYWLSAYFNHSFCLQHYLLIIIYIYLLKVLDFWRLFYRNANEGLVAQGLDFVFDDFHKTSLCYLQFSTIKEA